uniref:SRR1 domain containing n=1 Tax=Myotis myotis TaxID=51298 RepID=A0A7J7S3A2_MYOMY|nr:SRR1 domain containing [Myotis myotis]
MLHCGTALYNNLLWSNWSADALSKMVIIGNSFRGLEERLLTRILQKNYAYVAKVLEGLEEQAFPQTAQYLDVFNDISVHWFPVQKLKQLPMDTWASREEPDYRDCEDLEIIRNQAETWSPRPGHPSQNPHSPTLEDTALFMMSSASLNLSLMDGCASTWSENMDFQPKYHLVISS